MPAACVVLPPLSGADWHAEALRTGLQAVAAQLAANGWNTLLLDAGLARADASPLGPDLRRCGCGDAGVPLVAGPAPGDSTRFLRCGWRIAQRLRGEALDLVLAPLRHGLAQPLLMLRATGEGLQRARVALWAGETTAARLRQDELLVHDPAPLVDDALERCALRLADAVFAPGDHAAQDVLALHPGIAPRTLPLPVPAVPPPHAFDRATEIVASGPLTRRYGLQALLAAVERLDREGRMAGRSLVLLGSLPEDGAALNKPLLGVRAQHWSFPFRLEEAATLEEALACASRRGALPVFATAAAAEGMLCQALRQAGRPLLLSEPHRLYEDLAAALEGLPCAAAAPPRAPCWPEALGALCAQPLPAPASAAPSVSVCTVHTERPRLLRRALDSVPAGVECVVYDNASRSEESLRILQELEGRDHLKLIRGVRCLPQPEAIDAAARVCRGEVLVFLDDDNAFAPDGLRRLAAAFAGGHFDVVVSCLDLYDGPFHRAQPHARQVFMGDAGSAGLYFNGFGDMAMAIRRSAFEMLQGFCGGHCEEGALDWKLLARARAAGLRIGVLQTPAFLYARDRDSDAARKWRKLDQEGIRAQVLRCYAGCYDLDLVARVAQGALLQQLLE